MKEIKTGKLVFGKNHADLINNALGTRLSDPYRKSWVMLDDFGCAGVIAWFVFMDQTKHGYPDGWFWKNRISEDGQEIIEYNVSPNMEQLKKSRNEDGFYPYRLCFQLNPYKSDAPTSRYIAKFVGLFILDDFLNKDMSGVRYRKVSDGFVLGNKGEVDWRCLGRDELASKDRRYTFPVAKMNFSEATRNILLRGGIQTAGQLLELGLGCIGEFADEVNSKLYFLFHALTYDLKKRRLNDKI